MKKPIKISIIIPVFNEELYISDTIDSLLNQSTSYPFEIIIVDGISTDSTRQIVQSKINQNPVDKIKLIDNKNRIVSSGFNIGLSLGINPMLVLCIQFFVSLYIFILFFR